MDKSNPTVITTTLGQGALSGTVPGSNQAPLVNGQPYAVQVQAVDYAGLSSACSNVSVGTPYQIADFWTAYKNDGGSYGGCSESGGPEAVIGGALGLLALSRRKRKGRR